MLEQHGGEGAERRGQHQDQQGQVGGRAVPSHVAQAEHRHEIAAPGRHPAEGPDREGVEAHRDDPRRQSGQHRDGGQEGIEAHHLTDAPVSDHEAALAEQQDPGHRQADPGQLEHQAPRRGWEHGGIVAPGPSQPAAHRRQGGGDQRNCRGAARGQGKHRGEAGCPSGRQLDRQQQAEQAGTACQQDGLPELRGEDQHGRCPPTASQLEAGSTPGDEHDRDHRDRAGGQRKGADRGDRHDRFGRRALGHVAADDPQQSGAQQQRPFDLEAKGLVGAPRLQALQVRHDRHELRHVGALRVDEEAPREAEWQLGRGDVGVGIGRHQAGGVGDRELVAATDVGTLETAVREPHLGLGVDDCKDADHRELGLDPAQQHAPERRIRPVEGGDQHVSDVHPDPRRGRLGYGDLDPRPLGLWLGLRLAEI